MWLRVRVGWGGGFWDGLYRHWEGGYPNWNANLNILEFIRADTASWKQKQEKHKQTLLAKGLGRGFVSCRFLLHKDIERNESNLRTVISQQCCPVAKADVNTVVFNRLLAAKFPYGTGGLSPCCLVMRTSVTQSSHTLTPVGMRNRRQRYDDSTICHNYAVWMLSLHLCLSLTQNSELVT